MNKVERQVMKDDQEWIDKMYELIELGKGYDMYGKFGDALRSIGVEEESDEESESWDFERALALSW